MIVLPFLALATLSVVNATPAGLINCLENIHGNSNSTLTTPSSKVYKTDHLGFNYAFEFKPVAIYHPATTEDAAAAIKCASLNNVTIAPRSGGHSYEGYCEGGRDGVFVVDLNLMQDFAVDKTANIVTYGAGHRLGPLYSKLWDNGEYFIPAGTCPSVGVGGHGLGGGIGLIARKYGMLTDNIVGMTFIDADGTIRDVTASSNSDLFWALRGAGGGSYGLVTQFRAKIYIPPKKLTTMSVHFDLANYSAVIDGYGKWGKTASEDITTEMNVNNGGLDLMATFLGPKAGANDAIAGLFNLTGPPSSIDTTEQTWYEAATQAAYLNNGTLANPVVGDARYARGRSLVYRKPMSKQERDTIFHYISNQPNGTSASYIIIDIWGGKIDKPDTPSAFDNHRGVLYSIEFVSEWGDANSKPGLPACEDCLAWSSNFTRNMQKSYSSGPIEAYQNYIERDMPDFLHAYYGSALPRLKQIKKAVDPKNVFTFPQAIPIN